MSQFEEKVVFIVKMATKFGLTPQFEELEKINMAELLWDLTEW